MIYVVEFGSLSSADNFETTRARFKSQGSCDTIANLDGNMRPPRKNSKLRIISNVRVDSPKMIVSRVDAESKLNTSEDQGQIPWTVVSRPKNKNKFKKSSQGDDRNSGLSKSKGTAGTAGKVQPVNANEPIKRKVPKGSVVSIVGRKEGFPYAEALKLAREKISLNNLGIEKSKIRKAANGGALIEISGLW